MREFSIYLCIRNAQEEQSPRPVGWNPSGLVELPRLRRRASGVRLRRALRLRAEVPNPALTVPIDPTKSFPQEPSEDCDICPCRFPRTLKRSTREVASPMSFSYRDLKVWQSSMKLVLGIYTTTAQFPKHELYGLVSQMRRAAVSVPSNIAEGKGRLTDRDRAHFYLQSRGSLLELETQILIAQQLNYVRPEEAEPLLRLSAEVGKMLNALVEAIAPHATHPVSNRIRHPT